MGTPYQTLQNPQGLKARQLPLHLPAPVYTLPAVFYRIDCFLPHPSINAYYAKYKKTNFWLILVFFNFWAGVLYQKAIKFQSFCRLLPVVVDKLRAESLGYCG